jgi:hypothetical protein
MRRENTFAAPALSAEHRDDRDAGARRATRISARWSRISIRKPALGMAPPALEVSAARSLSQRTRLGPDRYAGMNSVEASGCARDHGTPRDPAISPSVPHPGDADTRRRIPRGARRFPSEHARILTGATGAFRKPAVDSGLRAPTSQLMRSGAQASRIPPVMGASLACREGRGCHRSRPVRNHTVRRRRRRRRWSYRGNGDGMAAAVGEDARVSGPNSVWSADAEPRASPGVSAHASP